MQWNGRFQDAHGVVLQNHLVRVRRSGHGIGGIRLDLSATGGLQTSGQKQSKNGCQIVSQLHGKDSITAEKPRPI